MADEGLVHKVRELGDMDLAALLCLISREHCIISTDADYLDDLTLELQLVASRTFDLSSVVVDCTPETTLDNLVAAIQLPLPTKLQPTPIPRTPSPLHARGSEANTGTHHGTGNVGSYLQQQQIANVILARNLDTAPKAVQIQCLELMRTRRIFTRTAVQACPKQFLLVAVLRSESAGQARLTKHLNDHFYISHWQDPEDGFPHLDEDEDGKEEEDSHADSNIIGHISNTDRTRREYPDDDDDDDAASQASSASVVRRTRSSKAPSTPTPAGRGQYIATADWALRHEENPQAIDNNNNNNTGRNQLFTETDISTLSTLSLQTHVDIEVQRYQMNIIAFLRLHRAVTPGSVPPAATTHFRMLIRSLAALHGLDFATPELVQLAARKIYAHRIVVVPPERERSMQWGSDLAAVKALLEDVQPEDVVEDVLGMVDVPL
ncbi:hypothetical protein F4782DRAFT_496472 [Xylaria castorea]|nr:hypothetical protein F4782DRAFT_496472 [Xylaria castorea]